jgi:hypothetical protein
MIDQRNKFETGDCHLVSLKFELAHVYGQNGVEPNKIGWQMKKKKHWYNSLRMVSIALINVGAVFRLPSSVCNMKMFEAVEHNVGPE